MTRRDGEGLPPSLESTLRAVLAAAHLPPALGREVADEIRAHFEDGLAAGRTAEEILAGFGDPGTAGALITRTHPGALGTRRTNPDWRWMMSGSEWWTELRRAGDPGRPGGLRAHPGPPHVPGARGRRPP